MNTKQNSKIKKVLISIPVGPCTRIDPKLVTFLIKVIMHYNFINPGNINISLDIVEGKPIDSVRNNCINNFLKTENDYILTLDSDIVPPDNVIEELIKWDKDIVGATCFSFQYGYPYAVIMDKVNGGYTTKKLTGERLVTCQATGAACVLMKRQVLIEMKKYLLEKTNKTMFYETKYNEQGELSWGQDFWFCENAMAIGYKIYIDTAIHCGHLVDRNDLKRVNNIMVQEQMKYDVLQKRLTKEITELKTQIKDTEKVLI